MPQSPDHSSTEPDPSCSDQLAMATERGRFPVYATFSQRYGYEPLPEPMRLGHISDDLRRDVWDEIHEFILAKTHKGGYDNEEIYLCNDFEYIFVCVFAKICQLPKTEIEMNYYQLKDLLRSKIMEEKFNKVLDYLEIILNKLFDAVDKDAVDKDAVDKNDKNLKGEIAILAKQIIILFDKYAAAYQLDISQNPYWFFPRASKEQAKATQKAIETLHQRNMNNATDHLQQAAEHMKNGQYSDSVADSIHAVESVAGEVDPKSNKTLGKALDSLEREGLLQNSLLKEALKKLHGYANQSGIRHGQQEGSTVNVGLSEAILMYGACASFAAYLTQKHQHLTPKFPPESQDQQRRQDP